MYQRSNGRDHRPLPFTTYSAGLAAANEHTHIAQSVAIPGQWESPQGYPTWQ